MGNAQATAQEFTDMTGIWRGIDGSVYCIRHDDSHDWRQALATTEGANQDTRVSWNS